MENSNISFNVNDVISALEANGGVFIDTHNGNDKEEEKLDLAILQVKNGQINLCAGYKYGNAQCFCLNPLYVKDNKVYLSAASCGGVVDYRYVRSTTEGIREYNKGHKNNIGWSKEQISIINLMCTEA